MTDSIYPQFVTHNAHTAAAILDLANDRDAFEFQRLHGMGDALHALLHGREDTRCRIYAPVGAHRDLLAYLVRRVLENGANSSFVNQIVDKDVPPELVAADPFEATPPAALLTGPRLFQPERPNSKGFDLQHRPTLDVLDAARTPFARHQWRASAITAHPAPDGATAAIINPADRSDTVGQVTWATPETVARAAKDARRWQTPATDRRAVLNNAADLFEDHFGEIFALLAREAGKTQADAVAELREAVDFLRYYAAQANDTAAIGTFACISPWNFPLAIFTGQIAAALAAGNAVLAKPAEQTPLIAQRAVSLLHQAGVPVSALQYLPGASDVGAALTANVDGVAFTGSTETARIIHRAMADNLAPGAPLIAETGGLNAMIVDSTALPEQAVTAIVESAFQSAGQRCSALRCLYVQEDIAKDLLTMLQGAMDALVIGDPWQLSTDVGPVIDAAAHSDIAAHIAKARAEGRLLQTAPAPDNGHFIAPTLIRVTGIADLDREIFGPVLHVATFKAAQIDAVIDAINATGYGLTFGLQTRIDDRVQHVSDRIKAGNIYVNRNQIGAVVGSQPFGGEGLSGTGPKAGGPHYLPRFRSQMAEHTGETWTGTADLAAVTRAIASAQSQTPVSRHELPGPTGESNVLTCFPRAPVLCLGPGARAAEMQAQAIRAYGGAAVAVNGCVTADWLAQVQGIGAVLWWGDADTARAYRRALAARPGPILSLITGAPDPGHALSERHVCVDTTAAGGNAALLGGAA